MPWRIKFADTCAEIPGLRDAGWLGQWFAFGIGIGIGIEVLRVTMDFQFLMSKSNSSMVDSDSDTDPDPDRDSAQPDHRQTLIPGNWFNGSATVS